MTQQEFKTRYSYQPIDELGDLVFKAYDNQYNKFVVLKFYNSYTNYEINSIVLENNKIVNILDICTLFWIDDFFQRYDKKFYIVQVSEWFSDSVSLENYSFEFYDDIDKFLIEIFQMLRYCHSKSLICESLYPSKILIKDNYFKLLVDYVKVIYDDLKADYLPDDDLYSKISPEEMLGKKEMIISDYWRYGLLVYFVFKREHLFNNIQDIFNQDFIYQKLLGLPSKWLSIASLCLTIDVNERIKSKEILLNILKI